MIRYGTLQNIWTRPLLDEFLGLMILTLIEVAAVGLDLTQFAEDRGTTEKVVTL